MADQAFFSGANFVFNVLLVRWLSPEAYGAYAVAFSVLLFASGFHNALIAEPMMVLGARKERCQRRSYYRILLLGHLALTFLISAVGLAVAAVPWLGPAVRLGLQGAFVALPTLLIFWLARRACYLEMRPAVATIASAAYATLLLGGGYMVRQSGWLSLFEAYLLLAGTGLILGVGLWAYLLRIVGPGDTVSWRGEVHAHWIYGRWVCGSALVQWLSTSIYVPLIGTFAGLTQVTAYRAVQNLVTPLQQIQIALGQLVLPWASQQASKGGASSLSPPLRTLMIGFVGFAGLYLIGVAAFASSILEAIYGTAAFAEYTYLLYYLGGALLFSGMGDAHGLMLKALNHPRFLFFMQFITSVFTLSAGVYLVQQRGVWGAAIGQLGVAVIGLSVLVFTWHRLRKVSRGCQPSP
ncbi:MAG: lipopolysaccharide biosynthesis protein [Bacteroidota bacterium]